MFSNNDLEKHESEFMRNNHGTLCVQWWDTKTVCAKSNCHQAMETFVGRKEKIGERKQVECPEKIFDFRNR